MQLNVLLNSKHAFPNEHLKKKELLKDIPSTAVIAVLCTVNNAVFKNGDDLQDQLKILDEIFLKRQTLETVSGILNSLSVAVSSNSNSKQETKYSIFAPWPLLKFMEDELIENRQPLKTYTDTTPELELGILKVIFLYNEMFEFRLYKLISEPKSGEEVFYTYMWPAIFFQYNLMARTDYFYDFIKGMILFLELSKGDYKETVENFLNKYKHPNLQTYLFQYMEIRNYIGQEDGKGLFSNVGVSLSENPQIRKLIELNTIDLSNKVKQIEPNTNFRSLRSNPFFKLTDDLHLVFHIEFVSKKLYDGLVFDFIDFSKSYGQPINLPDFKSRYSESIVEKTIFRKIMKSAFEKKYRQIHFPEKDGESDAYFLIGNTLYIVEFKDVYFKSEVIEQPTLESVKKEINEKICSVKGFNAKKNKGVGQLFTSIQNIETLDWLKYQKYQPSKLRIQPIMVVTDKLFSQPGVNRYCDNILHEAAQNIEFDLKRVQNLVIVDFEFLFLNSTAINKNRINLKTLIENYQTYLKRREKKVIKKQGEMKDIEQTYASFSQYLATQKIANRGSSIVKELFETFDLTYGLPKD